jgi:hypothetical protein
LGSKSGLPVLKGENFYFCEPLEINYPTILLKFKMAAASERISSLRKIVKFLKGLDSLLLLKYSSAYFVSKPILWLEINIDRLL